MESFQSLIICFSQTYHDRQLCLPSGGHQIKTSISRTKCKFAIKIWLQKKSLSGNISYQQVCSSVPRLPISQCHLGLTFLNITEVMPDPPVNFSHQFMIITTLVLVPLNQFYIKIEPLYFKPWNISIQFLSDQNTFLLCMLYVYLNKCKLLSFPRGNRSLEESEEMSG